MESIKSKAVLFLTRDGCHQLDRAAAKLLARCEVEVLQVTPSGRDRPLIDVLLHGKPQCIAELHASDAAGRVENAIRESSPHSIRSLQWVEEGISAGPRNASGIGDGTSGSGGGRARADSGMPPKYRNDQPNDRIKRDKYERNIPGVNEFGNKGPGINGP